MTENGRHGEPAVPGRSSGSSSMLCDVRQRRRRVAKSRQAASSPRGAFFLHALFFLLSVSGSHALCSIKAADETTACQSLLLPPSIRGFSVLSF